MFVATKMVLISRTGTIYTRGEIIGEELTEDEEKRLTLDGAIEKQGETRTAAAEPAVFVCNKPAESVMAQAVETETTDEAPDEAEIMIDAVSAITPSVPKKRGRRKE